MVSYILSEKNKFVSLMRKMKINYYGNLDEKDIADHKIFQKTVKPPLSDKSINREKYILMNMDN